MFKSIALIAFLIAPMAALAEAPAPQIVSADGQRFEYVTKLTPGDVVAIEGRSIQSGEKFHLTVAPNGSVSGAFGYTSVKFKVAKSRRDRIVAQLRSEEPLAVAMAESVPAAK
ncbi:MAG: hypothetical protein ACJ8EY_08655 [Sphingomicrobium sp.]